MTLPTQKTPWPPQHLTPVFQQIAHDDAWLTGDLAAINTFTQQDRPTPAQTPWQYNGGIGGTAARIVYGKPERTPGNTTISRHLKTPDALCDVSASILVGKPPTLTPHPDDQQNPILQETLETVFGSDLVTSELYQAARHAAALGWVIGRIRWDTTLQPHPWIEWVDPDQAVIEWAGNRPKSVLFWDKLPNPEKGKTVWRLFQSHIPGRINYALYEGTQNNVGMIRPFTDHPDTTYLANVVDCQ